VEAKDIKKIVTKEIRIQQLEKVGKTFCKRCRMIVCKENLPVEHCRYCKPGSRFLNKDSKLQLGPHILKNIEDYDRAKGNSGG